MSSDPQQNDSNGTGDNEQKSQDTARRGSDSSEGNSTASGAASTHNNSQEVNAQRQNQPNPTRYFPRNGQRTYRQNKFGGYPQPMMHNMVPMIFNPDLGLSIPFMPPTMPPHPMNGGYLTPTQPIPAQLTLPHSNLQGGAPAHNSLQVNDSKKEAAFRRNEEVVPRELSPDELIKKAEAIMEQLEGQQKMYDNARANGNAIGVSTAYAVDISDLILIIKDYFKLDTSEQKGPLTREEIREMRDTRDFLETQINELTANRNMLENENRKLRADNKALKREHGRVSWRLSERKRELSAVQQSILDLQADAISESEDEVADEDEVPIEPVWNVDAAEFTPKHRAGPAITSPTSITEDGNAAANEVSQNMVPFSSGTHRQSHDKMTFITPKKKHIARVVHSFPKLPIEEVQKKKKKKSSKKTNEKVAVAEEPESESTQKAGPSSAGNMTKSVKS
ncbi:unnamed protein product [Caenorhabditis brenneri]